MSDILFWWGGQSCIMILDFVVIYVMSHTLMFKRMRMRKEHLMIGSMFVILASMGYYFFDGWSGRVINHLLVLLLFKAIHKLADWRDIFIIYLIWFVTLNAVQAVLIPILSLFSLGDTANFLVIVTLVAIIIIILCKIFKWHRLFHAIRSNMMLKTVLFITFLFALFLSTIFNLNTTSSLFSAIAFVFVVVILFPFFMQLYQKSSGLVSLTDIKADLFTTAIDMVEEVDPKLHYQIYAALTKQYGLDVSRLPDSKKESEESLVHMELMNDKIQQLIETIILKNKKEIKIHSEITYYEPYKNVDFDVAVRWVEMLTDQLLKTIIGKDVYTYLVSTRNTFSIKVTYACDPEDADHILEQLQELALDVIKRNGKIEVDANFMSRDNYDYIQISIEMKKADDQLKF